MTSRIKSSHNIQPVYYKASGRWAPFGLLGLYGAISCSSFVLCLITHLLWAYWPDARWGSVILLIAWFWLIIIIAKHVVRAFKIRNPGLAFLVTMVGAISGYMLAWLLFWAMAVESTDLIEFIKINISKPLISQAFLNFNDGRAYISGGPIFLGLIVGLYFFLPSAMGAFQASLPFNENDNRWYLKKVLPALSFSRKTAFDAEWMLMHGEIDKFLDLEDYKCISMAWYYLPIFYLNGVVLLWFYYDKNQLTVYFNARRSFSACFVTLSRYLPISRHQANALFNKFTIKRNAII